MEKAFTKPYENGWDAKPASNSWVTPEIMDNYDNAIDEIDNRVIGQIEDLTQFQEDGFLPLNLFNPQLLTDANLYDTWSLSSGYYVFEIKVKPNTQYTFSADTITVSSGMQVAFWNKSGGAQYFFVVQNGAIVNKTYTFTTNADGVVQFLALKSTFSSMANWKGVVLREGTSADYTPYAPSNIELKENLQQIKDGLYNAITDLNQATNNGRYVFYAQSITNKPSDVSQAYGYLDVIVSNTFITQTLFNTESGTPSIYMRYRFASSWSNWYKFSGTKLS